MFYLIYSLDIQLHCKTLYFVKNHDLENVNPRILLNYDAESPKKVHFHSIQEQNFYFELTVFNPLAFYSKGLSPLFTTDNLLSFRPPKTGYSSPPTHPIHPPSQSTHNTKFSYYPNIQKDGPEFLKKIFSKLQKIHWKLLCAFIFKLWDLENSIFSV